ncbi:hypothetical protein GA0115240_16845 [Streptomyces sp. DvalAA-14]|uniref:hypothetical protein n=1 Tax=unclassified Streptomyces TaxID=2593676 RepID=UPI00081AEBAB|nr:hypothetical protein [Streptomyces sp. DvalAA-14]MYS24731.1 hypothetical protein [Streptomyces sp. SID4948]SCE48892.1 hypothetical protein GA0115240_16845 [Streptomyces sp. DvalAA-14]
MDKKLNKMAVRAGFVTAATTALLLISSPAFAVVRDDGDDPGPGLNVLQTLGLFVATPLVAFGIIAGLVILSERPRKQKDH